MPSYLTFSWRGQDILSVPAGPYRMRHSGVSCYRALTIRRFLFKYGLHATLALRSEYVVGRLANTPLAQYPEFDFHGWLAAARRSVGEPDAVAVVSYPVQPYRKRFYVNLLRPCGTPLGFAKVALDANEVAHLDREARNIEAVAVLPLKQFRPAEILAVGAFEAARYIVLEALPFSARNPLPIWSGAAKACAVELRTLTQKESKRSELSWWPKFAGKATRWAALAAELDAKIASRETTVAWAHGDFTRANIFVDGGKILVIDWEHACADAPLLTDEVQYFLGLRTRRLSTTPRRVVAALTRHVTARRDGHRRRDLAHAIAFLASTGNRMGEVCADHWTSVLGED